jgi:predicted secreted protein
MTGRVRPTRRGHTRRTTTMRHGNRIGATTLVVGLVGLLAAGAVAGCGAQQLALNSKDNGATIKASEGDTIVLKLDENPTTGYHWVIAFSGGLGVASNEYKQQSGTQNLVGAGGTHTWNVDVTGSGAQTITASYVGPGKPAVQSRPPTFSVTIEVK